MHFNFLKKKVRGGEIMKTLDIALICHEANRAYCHAVGDDSQKPWIEAPEWQKLSAIKGVEHRLANPESLPEDSHKSWIMEKEESGWKYGEVKDENLKTHPCMVPYAKLPLEQRLKDALFIAIVDALK
jgi:hypothetical protein